MCRLRVGGVELVSVLKVCESSSGCSVLARLGFSIDNIALLQEARVDLVTILEVCGPSSGFRFLSVSGAKVHKERFHNRLG